MSLLILEYLFTKENSKLSRSCCLRYLFFMVIKLKRFMNNFIKLSCPDGKRVTVNVNFITHIVFSDKTVIYLDRCRSSNEEPASNITVTETEEEIDKLLNSTKSGKGIVVI